MLSIQQHPTIKGLKAYNLTANGYLIYKTVLVDSRGGKGKVKVYDTTGLSDATGLVTGRWDNTYHKVKAIEDFTRWPTIVDRTDKNALGYKYPSLVGLYSTKDPLNAFYSLSNPFLWAKVWGQ